jgi:hypothetical protein
LYVYDGIDSIDYPTLSADNGKITIPAGQIIAVEYQMFSYEGSENTLSDFYKAIDGDETTYATIQNSGNERLDFFVSDLPDENAFPITITSEFNQFQIYFIVDNVTSNQSFQCGIYNKAGTGYSENVQVGTGYAAVIITPVDGPITSSKELGLYNYFFRDNPNFAPAAESTKVYTIGIIYAFVLSDNLAKSRER